ncbi:MAG: hypothetical protein H7269_07200 [Cellulomonas sp.]|nr:hypothetical protein [Cellulomonas sp.]
MPAPAPGDANTLDLGVLLGVLLRVKAGDFTVRTPLDRTGIPGKVADGLRDIIGATRRSAADPRVGRTASSRSRS